MGETLGEETAGILDAQALLLADPTFVGRVIETIVQRQVNAEWAVQRTTEEYERRFAEVESAYLRERGEDLRNVANYLLRGLPGIAHHELSEIQGDVVIIGRRAHAHRRRAPRARERGRLRAREPAARPRTPPSSSAASTCRPWSSSTGCSSSPPIATR